ncbi:AAR2 protein [Apiospora kogelbergensis]|uniref:AAR2 protein n=1 Tax=Apiospora kogelbergensis TaxID=1337665 RepID=UPI00312E60F7
MAPQVPSTHTMAAETISEPPAPSCAESESIQRDPPSYIDVSASTSHLRSDKQRPSPGSLKSVDSVPVTGVFPLGTLHLNDPKDVEEVENGVAPDRDMTTPFAVPERTPEPPQISGSVLELLRSGDVLILDDLPTGFTVGCDTISFAATEHFLGFRDIPAGAHLIWIAPSETTSSRSAYWIFTPATDLQSPGRVYVKQWDKFNEVLSGPASHAEERFQRERLEEGLGNLMPYQFKGSADPAVPQQPPSSLLSQTADSDAPPAFVLDSTTIWYQLTFAITPRLLNRLTASAGTKETSWPVNTSDRVAGGTSTVEEARLYANSTSQLTFTFGMDDLLFDTRAEGAERTQQALDPTSWVLSELRKLPSEGAGENESGGSVSALNDLVGELQFAFLTGMHLGNYACLEQWWHYTTRVIFRAYRLAVDEPQLARDLIQTVHAQLVYNDRNLEGSILDTAPGGGGGGSGAKKLQKALTVYKSRLNEQLLALGDECTPAQQAVGASFASLESFLWTWDWDLRGEYLRSGTVMLEDGEVVHAELSDFEDEDERGDFAAVVVDVDESGRPKDFVSM